MVSQDHRRRRERRAAFRAWWGGGRRWATATALTSIVLACPPAAAQDGAALIERRIESVFKNIPGNAADLAIPLTRRALSRRSVEADDERGMALPYRAAGPSWLSPAEREDRAALGSSGEAASPSPDTGAVEEGSTDAGDEADQARLPRPRPDGAAPRDVATAEAPISVPAQPEAGPAHSIALATAMPATAPLDLVAGAALPPAPEPPPVPAARPEVPSAAAPEPPVEDQAKALVEAQPPAPAEPPEIHTSALTVVAYPAAAVDRPAAEGAAQEAAVETGPAEPEDPSVARRPRPHPASTAKPAPRSGTEPNPGAAASAAAAPVEVAALGSPAAALEGLEVATAPIDTDGAAPASTSSQPQAEQSPPVSPPAEAVVGAGPAPDVAAAADTAATEPPLIADLPPQPTDPDGIARLPRPSPRGTARAATVASREDCVKPEAVDDGDGDFKRNAAELADSGLCITVEQFKERKRPWTVQVVESGRAGPTWAILHDDEDLSFDTGVEALKSFGGTLVAVDTGGERNQDGIDPNRNFSDDELSCEKLGPSAAPKFTALLRTHLDPARPVIALHSNIKGPVPTGGLGHASMEPPPKGYKVFRSKLADSRLADKRTLVLLAATNLDDAGLKGAVKRLTGKGVNVIVEPIRKGEGDCSLSNYAVLTGHKHYFNVTVDHDGAEQQRDMIEAIMSGYPTLSASR